MSQYTTKQIPHASEMNIIIMPSFSKFPVDILLPGELVSQRRFLLGKDAQGGFARDSPKILRLILNFIPLNRLLKDILEPGKSVLADQLAEFVWS